jgi:hypothetical protein
MVSAFVLPAPVFFELMWMRCRSRNFAYDTDVLGHRFVAWLIR